MIYDRLIRRGWTNKIAKTRPYQQTLLHHALLSESAARYVLSVLNRQKWLNKKRKKYILRAALLHDCGKERQEFQDYICGRGPLVYDTEQEHLNQFLKTFRLQNPVISLLIETHMRAVRKKTDEMLTRIQMSTDTQWRKMLEVVRLADMCASESVSQCVTLLNEARIQSNFFSQPFMDAFSPARLMMIENVFARSGIPFFWGVDGLIFERMFTVKEASQAIAEMLASIPPNEYIERIRGRHTLHRPAPLELLPADYIFLLFQSFYEERDNARALFFALRFLLFSGGDVIPWLSKELHLSLKRGAFKQLRPVLLEILSRSGGLEQLLKEIQEHIPVKAMRIQEVVTQAAEQLFNILSSSSQGDSFCEICGFRSPYSLIPSAPLFHEIYAFDSHQNTGSLKRLSVCPLCAIERILFSHKGNFLLFADFPFVLPAEMKTKLSARLNQSGFHSLAEWSGDSRFLLVGATRDTAKTREISTEIKEVIEESGGKLKIIPSQMIFLTGAASIEIKEKTTRPSAGGIRNSRGGQFCGLVSV